MAVKGQKAQTNVTPIQQTQARVLPDLKGLSALDQFKALLANMSPEERKQADKLMSPPKRDTGKLLAIKAELQKQASSMLFQQTGENLDGKEAFGVIWKAAWPKRYYHTDGNGQRIKLANGALDSWEFKGGRIKKPAWIGEGNCEVFEIQLDVKGNEIEVTVTNGDSEEDDE